MSHIQNSLSEAKPSFLSIPPDIVKNTELNARQWFRLLIEYETAYTYMENIWQDLRDTLSVTAPSVTALPELSSDFFTHSHPFHLALGKIPATPSSLTHQQITFLFKQYSPLFKVIGSWLTGITSIPYAWREDSARLLKQHIRMMGNGDYRNSLPKQFELSAQLAGLEIPEVFNVSFTSDPTIHNEAFLLPVYLLKVAMFPSLFYEETLGINLAMSRYLAQLSQISPEHIRLFGTVETDKITEDAVAAVDSYLAKNGTQSQSRLWNGYQQISQLIDSFEQHLLQALNDEGLFHPHSDMIRLMNKIGRFGCGYHQRGMLRDKPVDSLLNPDTFDPHVLLDALKKSKYIRAGEPDKSPFINMLTDVHGGMFGICSEEEIQIIRRWISGLEGQDLNEQDNMSATAHFNPGRDDEHTDESRPLLPDDIEQAKERARAKYNRISLQELYLKLLQPEQNPDLLPVALTHAGNWLESHRKEQQIKNSCPFSVYHHASLTQWFEHQHRKQVASYFPLTGEPEESREEVIEDATSLAPLTLIDGAWLRLTAIPSRISTCTGYLHYKILIDELGRGDIQLHHGNVYRQLLTTMAVDVPSFDHLNASNMQLFSDDDFLVPVYWLSVALFPNRFLPEILGLNLAMELSGVGGEYRRSGDVLRYYGFSSLFTDLHNTVDNVVTGHSAWALEAIKEHLDDVFQNGGEKERQRHWERIWLGYCSLNRPGNVSLIQSSYHSIKRFFRISHS